LKLDEVKEKMKVVEEVREDVPEEVVRRLNLEDKYQLIVD
jgi:hypothetical protein